MSLAHVDQRQNAISRIPQANYLTATAALAANFRRVESIDQGFASYKPNTANNRDHATGKGQATRRYILSHDTERKLDLQICSEELGRYLLLACGKVVTTQPNAALAPTVYKHVFTLLDLLATRQAAVTTYLEKAGDAINRKFPSMACESFGMKGDDIGIITGSMGLRGDGSVIEPAGIDLDALDDLDDMHYLYNSQAVFTTEDADANVTDYSQALLLNSWMVDIVNELLAGEGYRPGARRYQTANNPASGALRSECLISKQSVAFGANVRLPSGSSVLADLRSQAPLKWKVDLQGDLIASAGGTDYFHQLLIEGEKTVYEAAEIDNKNGLIGVDIKGDPLYDNDTDKQITFTLYNTVASYTV
ncbi:MAG: hypothetical protein ICV60_05795 [Pyrinomonadaceae bacterium]|nr:hypothetical protein [Pyrinomonadaceae bacterium]